MRGITAMLCVILGRFNPLSWPPKLPSGMDPRANWPSLVSTGQVAPDKFWQKQEAYLWTRQAPVGLSDWLLTQRCCPGSPDPGSVQGIGQDGWINNVCESNVRSNDSTGLVDTQTCGGRYSAINSRFMMMLR